MTAIDAGRLTDLGTMWAEGGGRLGHDVRWLLARIRTLTAEADMAAAELVEAHTARDALIAVAADLEGTVTRLRAALNAEST